MNKSKEFKVRDYLNTNEERAAYIEAAIEEKDDQYLLVAIREVIDSISSMTQLSKETGLARESLYRSLSEDGNPRYSTITKVLDEIGLKLSVSAK